MRKGGARIDFDSAWKFAVQTFLQQCLLLLFPHLHALIDWTQPPTFLNTELRKIRPESQAHRRFVDVLAQVRFKDGHPRLVYLHIEIQAQPDPQFPLRMFVYQYRIFDITHFGEVISLAILADADPHWRPDRFERSLAGCELSFRFPTVKLLDIEESALESSSNPFALVVLAHLRALRARGDVQLLFVEKVRLIRQLAERGYNADDVANLYRVVDYLMALPRELEAQVEEIVREVAREQRLPKLTSLERFALERGARQGLEEGLHQGLQQGLQQGLLRATLKVLRARFGRVPRRVERALKQIDSLETLEALSEAAARAETMDAFEQALQQMSQSPSS